MHIAQFEGAGRRGGVNGSGGGKAGTASRKRLERLQNQGFLPLRSMGSGAIGGANGGSAGARTQDQYLKRVLLYQLSYRPVRWRGGRDNTLALARCTHRLLSPVAPRGGSATLPPGGSFGR
jgi:hypothetical protein